MSLSEKYENGYRLVWPLTVIAMVAGCLWFGADLSTSNAQVTRKVSAKKVARKTINVDNLGGAIPGTGTGAIPDGPPAQCGTGGTPLVVTFDGSGLSGSITDVTVTINATHSWVGDVDARLVAPDMTEHIVFSRTSGTTSATTCGSSDNLIGVDYVFNNSGTTNWWDLPVSYPAGTYTTTAPGGVPAPGGGATDMNAAFAGANPTGDWELRVRDFGGGDTGSINSASLLVTTGAAVSQSPQFDFDGDGTSDYSIVRDVTPLPGFAPGGRRSINELQRDPGFKPLPPAGNEAAPDNHGTNLGWYIAVNGGNDPARVQGLGQPTTDFWVPEDYDGDGLDDIAVWRGVAPAGPNGGFFYTFTSSNMTVNEIDFGQQGDNPTIVGDYDGDGIADPAVYRCPSGGGQCTFFYKGSTGGGAITYIPWGNNSSTFIRPYPGDFDGDGKKDFCIFQGAQYILLRSSDFGVEWINFGLATDPVIAPGDYDGDGKTDFMNVRVSGSDVQWWLLDRTGSSSLTVWGALVPGFAEFAAPGDFDGDGSDDIGIWRRDNSGPTNSFFYTLRSSDGMLETFQWGSAGDAPVPGWNGN